jgi:hypothetical protein
MLLQAAGGGGEGMGVQMSKKASLAEHKSEEPVGD